MEILHKIFKSDQIEYSTLSGGDINQAYKVKHNGKTFAVKVNSVDRFPQLFEKEALGLDLLRDHSPLKIPSVIDSGEFDGQQYLVLEFINESHHSQSFWEDFGRGLARLHQSFSDSFGLDHSNYIGSLVQVNNNCDSWQEFYTTQRLEVMTKMAVDSGEISTSEAKLFKAFYNRIPEIYPEEKPALVHGDLWSGNYLVGSKGEPVLIDPAVYYGHREMDLGMMQLFGGFDKCLYSYYNEVNPLEKGWENRIPYSQLYPLMVHVNLFGRSYWGRVERILSDF